MGRRAGRAVAEALEGRRMLTVFHVWNVNDSGAGSLRAAIESANASPGADRISISILNTFDPTVQLSTALPAITDPVHVYASIGLTLTSQSAMNGLEIAAPDVTVERLRVRGMQHGFVSTGARTRLVNCISHQNSGNGVRVLGGGSLELSNCLIDNNSLQPIDVGGDGPTANDVPDADGVANKPVLTSAQAFDNGYGTRGALVEGTFRGPADTDVRIDLYSTSAPPLYNYEYTAALQSFVVRTDAGGFASFARLPRGNLNGL